MNRLWTERTVTFDGEFDRVQHAGIKPLPMQRPIPIWFGGGAEPVLRRAARYGQGWIPLGQPDEKIESQIERLHNYLRAEGRKPEDFGIEAWIRSSIGGPDKWREAAERWEALGATHITLYTSGQGVGGITEQVEAMQQFRDAVC